MECEVVVVGGGIGGLTVAALLAARGVDVCLLEREPRPGGCAASYEKFGYSFEQGYGLYAGWHANEIHQRIFSELPVAVPSARLLQPGYVVRLPDQLEIALTDNNDQFEETLRTAFPECAEKAVNFYRRLAPLGAALRGALRRTPNLLSASRSRRAVSLISEGRLAAEILKSDHQPIVAYLDGVSHRFRRFIDIQLQTLTQGTSEEVGYLQGALALTTPRDGLFAIQGGADTLANSLAESIRQSGGKVRLDTPVLRLSYDSSGNARGVDLLSGELVAASKAIVSNLTIWDTYGKLVGLNRTPTEIRKRLAGLRGWGAYLLYLSLDEAIAASLSSDHILALADWQESRPYDAENAQLLFAAAPSWDPRAPEGKRAVTVHAFTDVDDWFTFHKDQTELEERDQRMLESCWGRLHAALPELGSSAEVIETATPRTFYDLTRRKLGMVNGIVPSRNSFWLELPAFATSLPNLFIVSDTTYPGGSIASLTRSALVLANHLTDR